MSQKLVPKKKKSHCDFNDFGSCFKLRKQEDPTQ